MALFCFCGQINFSKDKNTGKGYCRTHQSYRTDFDGRSLSQRAMDKERKRSAIQKIRTLPHIKGEDKEEVDNRNGLILDLDAIVSRFVRIRDADEYGKVKCYTCPTVRHFTFMQCGHFSSRANMGLRWDAKRNLRTQCPYCNENLKGNLEVYAAELNKEEEGLSETLTHEARDRVKIGVDELKGMIIDYRAKLKIIEQKLKK